MSDPLSAPVDTPEGRQELELPQHSRTSLPQEVPSQTPSPHQEVVNSVLAALAPMLQPVSSQNPLPIVCAALTNQPAFAPGKHGTMFVSKRNASAPVRPATPTTQSVPRSTSSITTDRESDAGRHPSGKD
ncbi:unnamed protein product, partial [Choristocarpus tenellus]